MKLEWEDVPGHGGLWIGRADCCRYLATSGEEKLKIQGEHNAYIEQIAAANGYVKAEDYEALKAKLAEVTDQLEDATDTLDQIEAEAGLFDATAIASGYVKLEPGQVIVDKALHELALSMAHKWEQHIEGRVCASQEARDE